MAKKTAADLDMSPLAIAERHADACRARLEALWAEVDKMFGKTGDDLKKGISIEQYDAKLAEVNKATNELFKAVDNLVHQQRHQDDPPVEPLVPEEDVRAVINASLDDKMDELRFSLNRGMVASAIAKAIRLDVTEAQIDAPLCGDCS